MHLSALVNPIGAFEPVLQEALADVQALGQSLAADPAPILEQIIRNQATNIANLPAGIQAQIAAVPHLPELLAQAIQHQIGGVQSLGNVSEAFLQTFIGLFTGGALQSNSPTSLRKPQERRLRRSVQRPPRAHATSPSRGRRIAKHRPAHANR